MEQFQCGGKKGTIELKLVEPFLKLFSSGLFHNVIYLVSCAIYYMVKLTFQSTMILILN